MRLIKHYSCGLFTAAVTMPNDASSASGNHDSACKSASVDTFRPKGAPHDRVHLSHRLPPAPLLLWSRAA